MDGGLGFRLAVSSKKPGFRVWNLYPHPSDFDLALLVHDEPSSNKFDERAVGLDHFALRVRDRQALEEWSEHGRAMDHHLSRRMRSTNSGFLS